MPTRLIYRNSTSVRSTLRDQLRRAILAGASAGFVLGMTGHAFADGEMQLIAPLNSTQAPQSPEPVWSKRSDLAKKESIETAAVRPPKQVAPESMRVAQVQVERDDRSNQVSAVPSSGSLNRLEGPSDERPELSTELDEKHPDSKAAAFSFGDQIVDRNANSNSQPKGSWRDRNQDQLAKDSTESSLAIGSAAHQDTERPAEGFRQPAIEGNWVARNTNRTIPPPLDFESLEENASAAKTSQPGNPDGTTEYAKPIENVSPTAVANNPPKAIYKQPSNQVVTQEDRWKDRNAETIKAKSAKVKPEAYVKKTAPSPSSMSLGEAKNASDAASDPVTPPSLAASDSKVPKQTGEADKSDFGERVVKTLPKRKPLSNIVGGGLSSVRPGSKEQPQQAPRNRSVASATVGDSASVGDIAPTNSQILDYTGRPASPIRPTRSVANMRRGIERTLKYFYDNPEIATARSNWGMMHSLMVFEAETKVIVGKKKYSAIAWIAGNNNCRGQRLLTHDAEGVQAKSGVGLQGHQGQFLAVMGMCNVPLDYPLHAGKVKYDIAALIEAEQRACKAGEELSFTLIGLSHYLDTDSTWMADDGTQWDFERLIAEELKQPIIGAACGGTHRLMCFTHALRKRRAEGKPVTGHWKRAEIFTDDFINYAYSLQNRDGSMSTKWFEGRADNGEVDRKIQTTGHIVEWLLTVTPDDQLQDRRLVAAVSFLLRSVGSDLDHDWSIGPKGHALRSLAMYHQRVFRSGTPWIPSTVARQTNPARRTTR